MHRRRYPGATTRWGALATAAIVAVLVTAACGGGQPAEPSAEDVQRAEDALAAEEAKVDEAVQSALAALEAGLSQIDPCDADPSQIASLYAPLAVLQQTGDLGEGYLDPVAEALRPAVRAMARAYARGELPGVTADDVMNRAREVGIDPSEDDWMKDEACVRHWRLDLEWLMTLQGGPASLVVDQSGSVDFSFAEGFPFTGSGDAEVAASVVVAGSACSFDLSLDGATFELAGRHRIEGNWLTMDIEFGGGATSGTAVCGPGLTFDVPVNFSDLHLPVEMQAYDGETYTGTWAPPGGTGDVTLTLHRLD